MNPARTNRIAWLTMAVCLLAACSAKQSDPPPPATDSPPRAITPENAGKYIGQTVTVCGTVASAKYSAQTKGQPTYLNLNRPYPNQIFSVLIWGRDRPKFAEPPEAFYQGANICVTGRITSFRGAPEIVVHAPSQIAVNK